MSLNAPAALLEYRHRRFLRAQPLLHGTLGAADRNAVLASRVRLEPILGIARRGRGAGHLRLARGGGGNASKPDWRAARARCWSGCAHSGLGGNGCPQRGGMAVPRRLRRLGRGGLRPRVPICRLDHDCLELHRAEGLGHGNRQFGSNGRPTHFAAGAGADVCELWLASRLSCAWLEQYTDAGSHSAFAARGHRVRRDRRAARRKAPPSAISSSARCSMRCSGAM